MTEKNKVSFNAEKRVKSILNYLSPSLLGSLMPLITLPIMTRFLTPEDFGIIALATSFPSLITSLIGCNVDIAAQRYYFEYRKDSIKVNSLINSTTAFLFLVYIVSSLFVFVNKSLFSRLIMGNPECGLAIFISYLTVCLNILVTFYLTMYRNMERPKSFSRFTIIQMVMNATLVLFFVAVLRFGYLGVIYGSFLATLIIFCMLFWKFQREFPFRFDFKILKDNFKYGIPLLGNYLSGPVSQFLDKYLLRSIVSLSSAGIYSIAQNVSRKLFEFITAIQSTYHPIFMKDIFDRGKEAANSIGRNFTIFTYLSISVVLGMILFGEEIIHILAPSSYYGAINVMLII
ncbi:MAG: oligosaccharide flippase family protein, partial [Candidatus Omnitrophica bacterium]|nr:oligosaccharide flippase family protein [Candidatus Omnitrophota bacterium]